MLTTVSFDDFMALGQQLEEDSSGGVFNWNEFVKTSVNPKSAVKYLKACGVKKLGQGSSRAAYALKDGDVESVNGPCVLKLATHPAKGPAQNKAEAAMLDKYQKKMECFPKLYACDRQNWNYVLVELGTPFDKTPAKFRNEWLKPLREFFTDQLEREAYPEVNGPVLSEEDFELENASWSAYVFGTIANVAAGTFRRIDDEELFWYQTLINRMIRSQIPIVRSVGSVFKYVRKYGHSEITLGDLEVAGNWAFVRRDGELLLIPIDWGASNEVMKKYYAESITFERLKEIVFGR